MGLLPKLKEELLASANPEKAKILQRFFKTGKGEYGEGDIFFGLTVPESRKIARKYSALNFAETRLLLKSKIHEERLIALLILVHNFNNGSAEKKIYDFYLRHAQHINNWDLVDLSADKIVGAYLSDEPKDILYTLSRSENLWERRIAIISTFHFIKNNEFGEALKISKILLQDKHDLIQKAVGWMLREVGKRSFSTEEAFLKEHYKRMPRTMLRYAIEKFPEKLRKKYLEGKI
ncbi:MAG: DNA alkylation repair protein [Thaumarchaeota archaeon]|nr:DNA alkylation repair protein [Nitrososphaerota archaeon]